MNYIIVSLFNNWISFNHQSTEYCLNTHYSAYKLEFHFPLSQNFYLTFILHVLPDFKLNPVIMFDLSYCLIEFVWEKDFIAVLLDMK